MRDSKALRLSTGLGPAPQDYGNTHVEGEHRNKEMELVRIGPVQVGGGSEGHGHTIL